MYADIGIAWIDIIFDWCVLFLIKTANQLGITYEEINVWLFVIIGPCLLVVSICLNVFLLVRQARHPRHYFRHNSTGQNSAFFKRDNPPSLWK